MEEGRPFLSAKHLMKTIDSKNRAEKDVNRKRNIRAAKREDRLKAGQPVRSGKQSLKIDGIKQKQFRNEDRPIKKQDGMQESKKAPRFQSKYNTSVHDTSGSCFKCFIFYISYNLINFT